MYHNSPPVDYVAIIGGILSLIVLITFFVMAFRLRKIMEALKALSGIEISRAKKAGMIEIECLACERMNYIMDEVRPVYCTKCGKDLTKRITDLANLEKLHNKVTEEPLVSA